MSPLYNIYDINIRIYNIYIYIMILNVWSYVIGNIVLRVIHAKSLCKSEVAYDI